MSLTDEQSRLLRQMYPDGPKPSGDQTPEQAENLAVAASRYAFRLWGADEPAMPRDDEIREAIRRPSR